MTEKRKNIILNIMGIFILAWYFLAIFDAFRQELYLQVLWFSYFGLLIIGTGILKKNSALIMSQLNLLAIPAIIWSIDFIYLLISKKTLFGITNYFFLGSTTLSNIITLQHFFIVPIAFYSLYLIKIKSKDDWKVSFLYLIFIFIISRIMTSSENSVNCVYDGSCLGLSFGYFYPFVWFGVLFSLVLVTNFIINKISFLKSS